MLHDPAFDVLLPLLNTANGPTLWVADENALAVISMVPPRDELIVVTNRYDIFVAAKSAGHLAEFSDFDFAKFLDNSIRHIFYRISKEKPVVHHVLNQACRLLAADGELVIAGFKGEGTKTYIQKCMTQFSKTNAQKHGQVYLGFFADAQPVTASEYLDDQDYPTLRLIHVKNTSFYSKPGLFGWDSIDAGSAFLVEHLPALLASIAVQPKSMLDLGCGYGYLTLATAHLPLVRRVAADNNAAAIEASKRNAEYYGIAVDVIADDAGGGLNETFDLILCNPPFHQGFDVSGELTVKFLVGTHRLLSRSGSALFVVNSFIGLEKKAAKHFSSVTILAQNKSFKLVLLRR